MNDAGNVSMPAPTSAVDGAAANRVRVLLVNDHLGWGNQIHGVTRLFELWVSYLPADRYEVIVCILGLPSELRRGLEARGARLIFIPKAKYDPATALALARVIRAEKIDILHVQGYRGTTFGKIAARLTGVPIVTHFHDTNDDYPLIQKVCDRILGRIGDAHVAVSRSARTCWATRLRLPECKVRVIYNCASLAEFGELTAEQIAEHRSGLGIPAGARVVGCVTRLFPGKGTRYLLAAAPAVLARVPHTIFVIVGDGPERAELEALAVQLGVRDRVRFLGFVDRVAPVLGTFDIKVFTSYREGGSPLPVLEAMAMARPVIATTEVEIVEDGITGVVIPPQDPELLAGRIVSLLEDDALALRLGRAGQRACRHYDVAHYVDELDRLYRSLSGRRRRSPRADAGAN